MVGWPLMVLRFVVSVALAWLVFRFVERPLAQLVADRLAQGPGGLWAVPRGGGGRAGRRRLGVGLAAVSATSNPSTHVELAEQIGIDAGVRARRVPCPGCDGRAGHPRRLRHRRRRRIPVVLSAAPAAAPPGRGRDGLLRALRAAWSPDRSCAGCCRAPPRLTPRGYAVRRLSRIYPVYWVALGGDPDHGRAGELGGDGRRSPPGAHLRAPLGDRAHHPVVEPGHRDRLLRVRAGVVRRVEAHAGLPSG